MTSLLTFWLSLLVSIVITVGDSRCIDSEIDVDMEALCVDGVKKWLESEDDKND